MRITGGEVFTVRDGEVRGARTQGRFEKRDVYIGADRTFASGPAPADDEVIDASGCYVIPGLVDVHVHGCMGHDFSDANEEGLREMAAYQFAQGVTSFCPTSMTFPEERLAAIYKTAGCVPDDGAHAYVAGIHMEGPFVSLAKKGAQNPKYITAPDMAMLDRLLEVAAAPVRVVTVAPEIDGALDLIERFHDRVHLSLGHSAASYDVAREAFERGADRVTHLYNAMLPFRHREPGIVGAAAEREDAFVELICDGLHVHPSAIRATFALFGAHRVVLVSDSMRATGLPDGTSEMGGQVVYVRGRSATLEDGNLAASVSSLMTCMRCAVEFGIPLEDAVLAAATNPARSIGLGGKLGVIREGARGNAVILNRDLEVVRVI